MDEGVVTRYSCVICTTRIGYYVNIAANMQLLRCHVRWPLLFNTF